MTGWDLAPLVDLDHDRPELRVYDPWECDSGGDPKGWDHCGACEGAGRLSVGSGVCRWCRGHGSLRAAAVHLLERHDPDCPATNADGGLCTCRNAMHRQPDGSHRIRVVTGLRCEGCGHPALPPLWDPVMRADDSIADLTRWARMHLRAASRDGGGYEPPGPTAWSWCDRGCHHRRDGDLRVYSGATFHHESGSYPSELLEGEGVTGVMASWRTSEVRRLGHAHDLRPDRLAILCDRCDVGRER